MNTGFTGYTGYTGFKSAIIKTDISIIFQFSFVIRILPIAEKEDPKKEFIYKRRFSDQSIGTFKIRLRDINWSKVRQCRNANEAYINFFNIIDSFYTECFPVAKIRLKQKKTLYRLDYKRYKKILQNKAEIIRNLSISCKKDSYS